MPTGHGSREPWTHREEEIVCRFYARGVDEVAALLPGRSVEAIRQRAVRLGAAAATPRGLRQPCASEDRDAIIALHDQGMGYEAIARMLSLGAQAVTNAILFTECERAGFTPAQRDASGGLLAHEAERIYAFIRDGLPNVEIQRRMAVSAGCVSHYRRRLKKTGETISATGQGIRYSGTRYDGDVRKQVEHHFMQGYGAAKVAELSGVAVTFAKKFRRDLVERLARQGQYLPGCDITGRRVAVKEHASFVTDQQRVDMQWLYLQGWPVAPAAKHLHVGLSSAYAIVQQIKDKLIAEGKPFPKTMPPDRRPQLGHAPTPKATRIRKNKPRAVPEAYPALRTVPVVTTPSAPPPPPIVPMQPAQPPSPRRRISFEEQLALIAAGARLVPTFKPSRRIAEVTLGGVGSSLL